MAQPNPQTVRLNDLLAKWKKHHESIAEPERYCRIKGDLYQVRNPGFNGSPPLSSWPAELVDPDDALMAAVEHYFLCRCWVGTAVFPAWQLRAMNMVYDAGKAIGVTPNHNPNKPTSKLTLLQIAAKEAGIRDGLSDLKKSGKSAPLVTAPPQYY